MSRCGSVVGVLAAVFSLMAAAAVLDFKDDTLAKDQQQYCQLVALNNTDPDLGWPDFRNTFDAECNSDGTVKQER